MTRNVMWSSLQLAGIMWSDRAQLYLRHFRLRCSVGGRGSAMVDKDWLWFT